MVFENYELNALKRIRNMTKISKPSFRKLFTEIFSMKGFNVHVCQQIITFYQFYKQAKQAFSQSVASILRNVKTYFLK